VTLYPRFAGANFGERRTCEVRRKPPRRASGSVKLHSWVTALGQQGTKAYAECFCVSGVVWNHCTASIQHAAYSFGPHRLWAILPAHDFLAKRNAVSEGAIMQHPVYWLPRINLPRTSVNKGKKDGRGPRRPQHLIKKQKSPDFPYTGRCMRV
jgi:hypothetical protein